MAEAFGIACHELVSLDFRCGSTDETARAVVRGGEWRGLRGNGLGLPCVEIRGSCETFTSTQGADP